jgi:TolB-like protein
MYQGFATANLLLKRFGPAFSWAEKAYAEGSQNLPLLRTLAQCAAYAGNIDRANHAIQDVLRIEPGMSMTRMVALYRSTLPFKRSEDVETLLQGLRLAGLPEGADQPAARDAGTPLPLPDKPSIAVLPFQNMSGDPEQEYFADGMVEDIITALSRKRELFVIARNSSFAYKGKAVDIRQVGRELGVRYILEGSVRKSGNRIRITGQLIDAVTNAHLWADKFDGQLLDVFDLQDTITADVVTQLQPQLERAEIQLARSKPTSDLTAYDLHLRALAGRYQLTKEGAYSARELWFEAVKRDPTFARGWAELSTLIGIYIPNSGWAIPGTAAELRKEGLAYARRAHQLDSGDPSVLTRAGAMIGRDSPEEGLGIIDQSLKLDVNQAVGWGWSAILRGHIGDHTKAIDCAKRAMRLNPADSQRNIPMGALAFSYFFIREFGSALKWARRSLEVIQSNPGTQRLVVASLAMLGRIDEARAASDRTLAAFPNSSIALFLETTPYKHPADRALYVEALRIAGHPER